MDTPLAAFLICVVVILVLVVSELPNSKLPEFMSRPSRFDRRCGESKARFNLRIGAYKLFAGVAFGLLWAFPIYTDLPLPDSEIVEFLWFFVILQSAAFLVVTSFASFVKAHVYARNI